MYSLDMGDATSHEVPASALASLLDRYSTEVIPRDRKSIDMVGRLLESGTEVFVVSRPSDSAEPQIDAAVRLRQAGTRVVPRRSALDHSTAGVGNTAESSARVAKRYFKVLR